MDDNMENSSRRNSRGNDEKFKKKETERLFWARDAKLISLGASVVNGH